MHGITFWMEIGQLHFRHGMTTYTKEHAGHDSQCHNNQAGTKQWIKPSNDCVNRKQSSQEVIQQNAWKYKTYGYTSELCQKTGWPGHKHGSHQYQQNNGKYPHDKEHGRSHMISYNL